MSFPVSHNVLINFFKLQDLIKIAKLLSEPNELNRDLEILNEGETEHRFVVDQILNLSEQESLVLPATRGGVSKVSVVELEDLRNHVSFIGLKTPFTNPQDSSEYEETIHSLKAGSELKLIFVKDLDSPELIKSINNWSGSVDDYEIGREAHKIARVKINHFVSKIPVLIDQLFPEGYVLRASYNPKIDGSPVISESGFVVGFVDGNTQDGRVFVRKLLDLKTMEIETDSIKELRILRKAFLERESSQKQETSESIELTELINFEIRLGDGAQSWKDGEIDAGEDSSDGWEVVKPKQLENLSDIIKKSVVPLYLTVNGEIVANGTAFLYNQAVNKSKRMSDLFFLTNIHNFAPVVNLLIQTKGQAHVQFKIIYQDREWIIEEIVAKEGAFVNYAMHYISGRMKSELIPYDFCVFRIRKEDTEQEVFLTACKKHQVFAEKKIGEEVLVAGYPALLHTMSGAEVTLTKGIISQLYDENLNPELAHVLQTDASINPGNSGGPIIDREGFVLAIATRGLEIVGGKIISGINFGIRIDHVLRTFEDREELEVVNLKNLRESLHEVV